MNKNLFKYSSPLSTIKYPTNNSLFVDLIIVYHDPAIIYSIINFFL